MTTWTTQAGEVLEIKWMQSQHLVHSFNMLARKHGVPVLRAQNSVGNPNIVPLWSELSERGLFKFDTPSSNQLSVPQGEAYRETPMRMCMLRAILNLGYPKMVDDFYADLAYIGYVELMTRTDHPAEWAKKVWVEFVRLALNVSYESR